MDIGDKHEQGGEVLPVLHETEPRALFDRIGQIRARVGEPNDAGLRRLRLE